MTKYLYGDLMTDRAAAHEHLKQQLDLPDYYGKNLDALYDVLTSYSGETTIFFVAPELVEEALGGYGTALITTIREAVENNYLLHLVYD